MLNTTNVPTDTDTVKYRNVQRAKVVVWPTKWHFDRTVIKTCLVNRRLSCSKAVNLDNIMMPLGETGRGLVLIC